MAARVLLTTFSALLVSEPALAHHVMGGVTPTTLWQGLLSGLGHPVIGTDHLAAVVAVGCLAATQPRGAIAAAGYVFASLIGVWAHIGEATVPYSEALVAVSVVALGLMLFRSSRLRLDMVLALFAAAGLINGYALGESMANAERTPIIGYFIGLAMIQIAIALAIMHLMRFLAGRATVQVLAMRVIGGLSIGVGAALLLQQYGSGI